MLYKHLYVKGVFHACPGRASAHPTHRSERIVLTPVEVDLERVQPAASVVDAPLDAAGHLLNGRRINAQNLAAAKERIVP